MVTDDLKPEGIRSLLLGPMSLLAELMGGLIPGAIFLLLLVGKHVPEANSAIGFGFMGYKTKVACGLLVAFVIGRMFLMPVTLIESRFFRINPDELKMPFDPNKSGSLWERLNPRLKKLLEGVFLAGFLRGSTSFEHLIVIKSEVDFRLSMGLALITAASIPGDGRMRWAELLVGLFFLAFGILFGRKLADFGLSMIGMSAIDIFLKSTEEQRKLVIPIISGLFAVPTDAFGPSNVQPVSQPAAHQAARGMDAANHSNMKEKNG